MAQPQQFTYTAKPPVINIQGDTLQFPFTGGFDAPQFSTMDLDGDGTKDLFVFDRNGDVKLTFLYKTNRYVYAPKYENMFPPLTDWVRLMDYNCDGREDILTEVDYNVKPEPNKLLYKAGARYITNVSSQPGSLAWRQTKNQLYDAAPNGNQPLNLFVNTPDITGILDLDNDGDVDFLCFPSGGNKLQYYQNMSVENGYGCDSFILVRRDAEWGYMYFFMTSFGFKLGDTTSYTVREYGKRMHNAATLFIHDMDGDGDHDMLYGDAEYNGFIYLENGKTINKYRLHGIPHPIDSMIRQDKVFPHNTVQADQLLFPAAYYLDVDHDSVNDMIIAPNASKGIRNKNQVFLYHNNGRNDSLSLSYTGNNFLTSQTVDLGGGAIPAFVDLDGDSDLDLVIATHGNFEVTANANDRLVLYENTGTKSQPVFHEKDTDFLSINAGTDKIYYLHPAFGDLNGDGKPDLVTGDQNGKLRYYANTSSGSAISFARVPGMLGHMLCGVMAKPQIVDLDRDGKNDLVVGARNGIVRFYRNTGRSDSAVFAASATIDSLGHILAGEPYQPGSPVDCSVGCNAAPFVADLDQNGSYEIVVGSASGRVFVYSGVTAVHGAVFNPVTNLFRNDANEQASEMHFGPNTNVAVADVTGDGRADIIIGNERGGIRVYEGSGSYHLAVENLLPPFHGLELYPNPARGELHVSCGASIDGCDYQIFNLLGQSCQQGMFSGGNAIPLTLAPGIYVLQVHGSVNGSAKFIVSGF